MVELAFRIPGRLKAENGHGKVLPKRALAGRLPQRMPWRCRHMFAVPVDADRMRNNGDNE